MIKYKILAENSRKDLENSIDEYLNGGWAFHGYTFVDKDGWFYQAVTKSGDIYMTRNSNGTVTLNRYSEELTNESEENIYGFEQRQDRRLMDIQITMSQEYAHTLKNFIDWFVGDIGDNLKKEKKQLRELLNDLRGSLADPPHAYTTRGAIKVRHVDHE